MSSLEDKPFKPLSRGNYFVTNQQEGRTKSKEVDNIDIKISLKDINIEITKIIRILKDLDYANIENWIAVFNNIATQARWNDEEKVIMVQMTVSPSISMKLDMQNGFQACTDSIYQCIYTPEKTKSLSLYLKGIDQDGYYLIDNYYADIRCTIHALATIQKWGKGEINRRIDEEFFRGLNQSTELKMHEIGKTTVIL